MFSRPALVWYETSSHSPPGLATIPHGADVRGRNVGFARLDHAVLGDRDGHVFDDEGDLQWLIDQGCAR
jgi:hypothetical protein